jgi:pyruvate carboxylase
MHYGSKKKLFRNIIEKQHCYKTKMKQNLLKMQNFNLFQNQLATKIKVSSEKENILFGLFIYKKLYPDYVKFINKYGDGDGDEKVIQDSIEYLETYLKQETLNDEKIKP